MPATKEKPKAQSAKAESLSSEQLLQRLVELLSAREDTGQPEQIRQMVYKENPFNSALKKVDDQYAEIRGDIEDEKIPSVQASDYELRINAAWRRLFKYVATWGDVPIVQTTDDSDEPHAEFVKVK